MCTGDHPFIPAPGIINVQVICTQFGQRMENVFNVRSGGGTALADLNRIRDKFLDWMRTDWRGQVSNTVAVDRMILKDISTSDGAAIEVTPTPSIAGGNGNTPLPAGTTSCLKWSTGLAGRSRRGRTFYIGLCTNAISGNSMDPPTRDIYVSTYTTLMTKLAAGGTVDKLVVVSNCNNNTWRTEAVSTDISGCSMDLAVDSQRRRLTGRGR